MHIAWNDLQTVEALVRTGSVEAAARELSMRHSSVSRRIAGLEARLGAVLFIRGAKLKPTELAMKIAERAGAMHASASAVEALVSADFRARAQRLVVTTNDVLAPLLFLVLAKAGHRQMVDVLIGDAEFPLAPGQVDLALRPAQDPSGALRGRRLGRLRLGVYSTPGAPEAWVMPSESLRAKSSMSWWRYIREDEPSVVTCNSLLGIRDACRAGLGRAVLPRFLAHDDLRLRLEREIDSGPPVWLLSPATSRASRDTRVTRDAIAAALIAVDGAFRA